MCDSEGLGDQTAALIVCLTLDQQYPHMWPNTVLPFNHSLGAQIVCLGYLWILRNDDKSVWKNRNMLKKMQLWSAGYTSLAHIIFTKQNIKINGMVNCQNSQDKGPQNSIVPVGRPRPYSIIILNMHFIPKASLRASSQITASSCILERHPWVNNAKPLALDPTWSLACKQTDCGDVETAWPQACTNTQ